jgi:hypothetical protein
MTTAMSEGKGTGPTTHEGGSSSTKRVFLRLFLISGANAALRDAPLPGRERLHAAGLTKGEERL